MCVSVCVHELVVARKRAAAGRDCRASGALAMAEDALQTAINNKVDEACLILNPCQIPNRGYGCETWGTVGLTTLAVACWHLHAMGLTEAERRARDILVIRVQQQMPAEPVGRDNRNDYLAILQPALAEAWGEDRLSNLGRGIRRIPMRALAVPAQLRSNGGGPVAGTRLPIEVQGGDGGPAL